MIADNGRTGFDFAYLAGARKLPGGCKLDKERKCLLYIITRADIGGAQTHVRDLIQGFAQRYEVHLATGATGPLADAAEDVGARVHLLPNLVRSINPLSDIHSLRDCVKLIRSVRPDLVHAHSSKAGIVGRVAARMTGTPAVFTAHGWGFSPGTPALRSHVALWSERCATPFADKIICVSENDRQLALQRHVAPAERLETIRCALDPVPVPQADPGIQPPRFVMVARFSEQKDQVGLMCALRQVRGDFHLDLIGSGPNLDYCRQIAHELGVEKRITFCGDREDVPALLARAQCFVLSTHYEGLPISILEAMRAGLPVVATNLNGIPEEVDDGGTGLLVPRGDVSAMASALQKMCDNPEMRIQFGAAGREKFLREFTIHQLLKEVESTYQHVWRGPEVLGQKRATA
jgi:glycosyltransferase involved in cell wall biosynthesis